MLPSLTFLKLQLEGILRNKFGQGHQTSGYLAKSEKLPASYDAYLEFAHNLSVIPMRDNWPNYEPNDLDEIWRECDPARWSKWGAYQSWSKPVNIELNLVSSL